MFHFGFFQIIFSTKHNFFTLTLVSFHAYIHFKLNFNLFPEILIHEKSVNYLQRLIAF